MNTYYVTFSASGGGWWEVKATSYNHAQVKSRMKFGSKFYGVWEEVYEAIHPQGLLGVLE